MHPLSNTFRLYGKGGIDTLTSAYAFAHFAVDLGCAFALFSNPTTVWHYFIYNLFAFAMQMPIGLLADTANRNRLLAVSGAGLTVLCCLLPSLGLAGTVLLGLGNGMFHVGGGLDVMNHARDRATPLGIFVSPGAFGVYFGTLWGKASGSPVPVLGALLAAILVMLLIKKTSLIPNVPVKLPKNNVLLPACLLFAVVILRSCGGAAAFTWKTGPMAFIAVCAVVVGKVLGGVLSDRFGAIGVSICSLSLCAVLFLFGNYVPAGLGALVLFNMTMPITLFSLSRMMPGAKGFSFGLLTFALFVGFLPSFFGAPAVSPAGMAGIGLLSCALLAPALKVGDRI